MKFSTEDLETYGTLIGKARREAGITQEELADDIRVQRETVSRWERDKLRYTPPAEEMHRLCARLPELTEVKLLWSLSYDLSPLVDDHGNPAPGAGEWVLTRQERELIQSYRQLTSGLRRVVLVQAQATAHHLRGQPPET